MKLGMKKERGKFLTIMLVLAVFGIFQYLFMVTNTNSVNQSLGVVPSWYPIYGLVGIASQAIAIVGIWIWKKWGVYLLLGWSLIGVLMQIFVLKPAGAAAQYGQLALFMTLGSAGLYFWAVYRKWQYFE